MPYFNLHLTSSENKFNYNFQQNFLDKKYEIGLVKLDGSLIINNINSENNSFIYHKLINNQNNNIIPESITTKIPEGNYNLEDIINEINSRLPTSDKNFFSLKLNEEDKAILNINRGYKIDFFSKNTFGNILGFENKLLGAGKYIAFKEFNPTELGNIFLKCNLIEDSYLNNKKINLIYRFQDNEIIKNEPKNIIYHKVVKRIDEIILNLVDINNNSINFSEVNLFVDLNLKELSS